MLFIDRGENPPLELLASAGKIWSSSVVVPVRHERRDRLQRLLRSLESAAPRSDAPALLILVLNSKASAVEAESARNEDVRRLLEAQDSSRLDICLLDHASSARAFPEKTGVGQARKLGCDLAAELFHGGFVRDSWIRCTDADAEVSADYFAPLPKTSAAVIFPFRHVLGDDPAEAHAALVYDSYLRYLRLGMHVAGSTFAYHSIGSLIAFQAPTYRVIRGFPDVEAGEDFYFLNKVRKQGRIDWAQGLSPLRLEGRVSNRVPFGTGRSIIKILSEGPDSWAFYHPESFRVLGAALEALTKGQGGIEPGNSPLFFEFLTQRRMREKFASIGAQCKSSAQWQSRSLELFDAFEQMKFLHFLRERGLPSQDWRSACGEAWFLSPEIRQSSDDLKNLQRLLIEADESTPFV